MPVKIVENSTLDITKSLLMEDDELREDANHLARLYESTFNGGIAFSEDMKVYPLISGFISRRLNLTKKRISFETAMTYASNLTYLVDYLNAKPAFSHCKLDECLLSVNSTTIEIYLDELEKQGLRSTTIRNRDATYLAFFNRYLCAEHGSMEPMRADDPYEDGKLKSSAPTKDLITMCTVSELEALICCCRNERERSLIQFMYDSGLRRSEIPRVTKEHISTAQKLHQSLFVVDDTTVLLTSNYCHLKIIGSKGRERSFKIRQSVVSRPTINRVAKYHATPLYKKQSRIIQGDKPAFLNAHGKPWTAKSITSLLSKLSKRAIKLGLIKEPISPHKLRHGFAGITLRSKDIGKDSIERLIVIKSSLGHEHLETTEIYNTMPYETYDKLIDKKTGAALYRWQIMEHLYKKSKLKVGLKDVK